MGAVPPHKLQEVSVIIIFDNFPIPPSLNHCYPTVFSRKLGRAIRVSSGELKKFKRAADNWEASRPEVVKAARRYLLPNHRNLIQVDAYVGLHSECLFTREATRKKYDVSNRVKPLHDALAEILGIDDRFFSVGETQPVLIPKEKTECVLIRMAIREIQTMSQVHERLLTRSASS